MTIQETKIIDLQEELVNKINESEKEAMSSKQLYEHQIEEYRKIIKEMEKAQSKKKMAKGSGSIDGGGNDETIRAKNEEIAMLEDQNHDLHLQL